MAIPSYARSHMSCIRQVIENRFMRKTVQDPQYIRDMGLPSIYTYINALKKNFLGKAKDPPELADSLFKRYSRGLTRPTLPVPQISITTGWLIWPCTQASATLCSFSKEPSSLLLNKGHQQWQHTSTQRFKQFDQIESIRQV